MRLDFTAIEGFNDMTPEEKLEAITNYDFHLVDKKLFDKKTSELAELKKTSVSSNEEYTNQIQTLTTRLETLEKEKKVSEVMANYLSLGYTQELAQDTAQAFVNNDFEKVFANQKTYQASLETSLKEKLMASGNPSIPPTQPTVMTKQKLMEMNPQDRYKFYQEHKDEYKEIIGDK